MKLKDYIALFITLPAIFYLTGVWITLDFNPLHWWLITHVGGRITTLVIVLSYLLFIFRYVSTTTQKQMWSTKKAPPHYKEE